MRQLILRNGMGKLLFTLVLLLTCLELIGQDRRLSQEEAIARVAGSTGEILNWGTDSLSFVATYYPVDTSVVILVLTRPSEEGFIITHNLPDTDPVLAYSLGSNWGLVPPPPGLLEWMDDVAVALAGRQPSINADEEAISSGLPGTAVTPLLSTAWDQTCLYNDSCPSDVNAPPNLCGHVWAGCVATAMAQVMRYFSYPAQGTGSKSYYSIQYGNQHANFGSTTYDWTQMPILLNQPSPEVARLMYHCGVSVEMNYHLLGSGALTSTAASALKTYFGYHSGLSEKYASSYSQAAWAALLKQEIDSARPVIYRSEQSTGGAGHAWVVDGYDQNGLFHCNWGWGGYYNGYFALSSLNPNLNSFNQNHGAITGIRPAVPQLSAHFSSAQTIISAGDSLSFTDLSLGTPGSWNWIFPGGTPSSSQVQHPQNIKYNVPGRYNVILVAGNGTTSDTLLKENYILVAPLAEFSADRRVIAAGDSVSFTDLSYAVGSITSYQWSFPGGSPSSSTLPVPPSVMYTSPGVYDVSLSIQAGSATHTLSKPGYISVYYDCDTLFDHNGKTWSVDSAILPGFTYLPQDLDGLTPYFAGAPYFHTSGWIVFNDGNINPQDTNYFLGAASFFSPPGIANNWLSFGPFPVWPEGIQISWKHYFYANNKRDGYEVLWSHIGPVYPQFTEPPLLVFGDNDPLTDGDTAWTTHSLSFTGSPVGPHFIWLAFRHFANNQFYLFLDDIQVVRCTSGPVGVQEIAPGPELRAWPNPANNILYIHRSPDLQMPELRLAIYSTDGRKLDSFKIPEGQNGITADVSRLPQGMYILQTEGQGSIRRQKVIISR